MHVSEVHKVKNYLCLFLDGFSSVSPWTQYCRRACNYSILQHKCYHLVLDVTCQLKELLKQNPHTVQ